MIWHTFDVDRLTASLWDAGMDEDPYRSGYLDADLAAHDGHVFAILSAHGTGPDRILDVEWDDGTHSEITVFAL
jgi:hypothetical protein